MSLSWNKETILSPHDELNLRPSDSTHQCSTAEPQGLYTNTKNNSDTSSYLCSLTICGIKLQILSENQPMTIVHEEVGVKRVIKSRQVGKPNVIPTSGS